MDSFLKKLSIITIFHNQTLSQAHFLKRLGTMLEAGFSLREAIKFLKTIEEGVIGEWLKQIEQSLGEGVSLISVFEKLSFPQTICAQLYFAADRGYFDQTLTQVGEQLIRQSKKKKELKQLLHYPLILCVFLIGMLLMIRFYLLPHVTQLLKASGSQLSGGSLLLVQGVYQAPMVILVFLLVLASLYLYYRKVFKSEPLLKQMNFWMKIPIISNYYELYWTQFYFQQWSDLILNGSSLYEIVLLMSSAESESMLKEIGMALNREMAKGVSFHEALHILPFIKKEAQQIIAHGEESGRMAIEMKVYSQQCLNKFNQKVELLMEKIQPLIFILVALMVVAIYGALMLPTFKLMQGF